MASPGSTSFASEIQPHGGGSAVAVGTAHGFCGVSLIEGKAEPETPRGAGPVMIMRIQLDPADASTV